MSKSLLGIILLVLGVVLVVIGINASESVSDTVSEAFTGRFTDMTMWYLIGGVALALAGAGLAVAGHSSAKAT